LLLPATPVSAHANLARSEPVAGSPNPVAPTEVRLFFTENPEPKYSEIKIYDPNRKEYTQGVLRPIAGDPLGLAIDVQPLPEGFYTVVWRANSAVDGHTTAGSFAFAVGSTPPPAATAFGDIPSGTRFTPPTPAETITKWLAILAATTVVGALGLLLLVWLPTLRATVPETDGAGTAVARRIARRLIALTGLGLTVLLVTTVVGLVLQAAKVTNRSALGALDGAVLSDFLFNTRTGAIWSARVLLPLVAGMFLGPLIVVAVRGERRGGTVEEGEAPTSLTTLGPLLFGLTLGMAYLLTISLISHGAAAPFWVPFTVALDWLHLLGTAVWVGGLFGLILTLPLVRGFGAALRPVFAGVVIRFSRFATISIIVLSLTGLYGAWLHVGSLAALLPTEYGRALTIKLVLFAGLVALGAFSHFWLRPLLAAPLPKGAAKRAIAVAEQARTTPILLRQFGRAIRVEALLGVAVILAVAFMTGFVPAREAIVEARAPKREQTIKVDDLTVTLTLAALQPGDNSFDIFLRKTQGGQPVADAERVALRLTHPEMDMGEAEAIATSRGGGHYTASGPYLSMSGRWDIRVLVRRANVADIDQMFTFPIGSTANLASAQGQFTAPQLPRLNSLRGIGFVALGVGLIFAFFGVRLFRRGSGFGTALLMLVPTALVVGGYLVYNGEPNEVVFNRPVEPANPYTADAASIARGQRLFAANCVVCHGAAGQGDGPQAATLNPRPPDFTQPHTAYHSDGYLFNAIRDGFPGSAMPAWGDTFSDPEKWDLVNYIRQFNRLTAAGATPPSVTSLPTAVPPTVPTVTPAGGGTAATPTTPGSPTASATRGANALASVTPRAATPVASGDGRLIYAFDGAIWANNPAGGAPANLTPTIARDAYAGDPALSPDGTILAYTVVVVPAPAASPSTAPVLPGTDIWLMDQDGRNPRRLFTHDQPGTLIQSLTWADDGKSLLYTYTAPVLGPDGRYLNSLKEIQRLDLASGARSRVVKGGQDPGVASAGGAARLAYVLIDPQTFAPTLWIADAAGQNGQQLIGTSSRFQAITAPRFSPDGKTIVFAGSGGPTADAPLAPDAVRGENPLARFARWIVAPLVPQLAAAHGLPADLWLFSLESGALSRLTALGGDDPVPAWSPDGRRIAFLSGSGLFMLELSAPHPLGATSPGLKKISDRGSYSMLVWSPR
jgi:copper transport protein